MLSGVSDTVHLTKGLLRLQAATEGLTGAQIGEKLGATQSFISRLLAGTRLPGRALAGTIANAYGIPVRLWDVAADAPDEDESPDPAPAATGTENASAKDG